MKRVAGVLVLVFVLAPLVFVADQARRTLDTLTTVERERDTWQRPEEIIRHLDLRPGATVVDLGSGAGYFALKIAPRVATGNGRVLAVDLRRQSLAFLWIRALRGGHTNLFVIHGRVDDPELPPGPIDAVLIANTYHELTAPAAVLKALFTSMRSGGRLVVVDRGPRDGEEPHAITPAHHDVTPLAAERDIVQQGFQTVHRENPFIDRPTEKDIWWLLSFRKP